MDGEDYQAHRLRLIDYWVDRGAALFDEYQPTKVANEMVPPVGSGNFMVAVQSQLVLTALTAVHMHATSRGIPIYQYGASTVKKRIGGHGKATKVKVRDGVYYYFPEIKDEKWARWVKEHDESDACAVGLVGLGYTVGQGNS